MLLLDRRTIEGLIDMRRVLSAVEGAFRALGRGEALMPPKVYLNLPQYGGDFRAMPAYIGGAAGLKWVNSHPRNPQEHHLPTVMALVIYSDPATGRPLALMDGTLLTRYRTGAAGGVAAQYLARPQSRTLGIVGCGAQAYTQIEAIAALFPLEQILLYDISPQRAAELRAAFPNHRCQVVSLPEAVQADIVCTQTPVTKPIVRRQWIKPGTHLNAIGADAPGKEELEPEILLAGRLFVDDLAQASHGGEVNVPLARGLLRPEHIVGTLGEVVAGLKPGRRSPDEITIFDSTGLAVQDMATAQYLYEEARRRGLGLEIDLLGLAEA